MGTLLAVFVQVRPRWESQAKFRHYGASNFKVPSARRLAATLALRTCPTLSRTRPRGFRSTCVICSHRRVVRCSVSRGLLQRLQVGQCEVTEKHGTSVGVVSASTVSSAVVGPQWPRFGYSRRPRKCCGTFWGTVAPLFRRPRPRPILGTDSFPLEGGIWWKYVAIQYVPRAQRVGFGFCVVGVVRPKVQKPREGSGLLSEMPLSQSTSVPSRGAPWELGKGLSGFGWTSATPSKLSPTHCVAERNKTCGVSRRVARKVAGRIPRGTCFGRKWMPKAFSNLAASAGPSRS